MNTSDHNHYWEKLLEFIRFSAVGGAMTVLNFVLYTVLNEYAGMHYLLSNALSYAIAVVLSYFLNLRLTFKEKNGSSKSFLAYISMRVLFLGADSVLLFICVQWLGADKYIAKIVITFVMLLLTYSASRRIFTKRK